MGLGFLDIFQERHPWVHSGTIEQSLWQWKGISRILSMPVINSFLAWSFHWAHLALCSSCLPLALLCFVSSLPFPNVDVIAGQLSLLHSCYTSLFGKRYLKLGFKWNPRKESWAYHVHLRIDKDILLLISSSNWSSIAMIRSLPNPSNFLSNATNNGTQMSLRSSEIVLSSGDGRFLGKSRFSVPEDPSIVCNFSFTFLPLVPAHRLLKARVYNFGLIQTAWLAVRTAFWNRRQALHPHLVFLICVLKRSFL